MGQLLYTLAVLLALLRPNIAEPYGRLGCRFSPVCEEQEVCAEDKLFGTCTKQHSPYLPVYKLDNVGLHKLKSSIRYLINSGYAWDDKYAQDSLRTVLDPYRREYLDVTRADLQTYIEEWLTRAVEEELEEEYLVEIAQEYQAMMDKFRKPLGYIQQGPYRGYDDTEQMAGYYGENGLSEGAEDAGDSSSMDYLTAVAEEYLQAANQPESKENANLQELYQLYRETYTNILGNPGNKEALDYPEVDEEDQQGYNNDINEMGNDANDLEDTRVLQKLQSMKEYMQDVYDEHKDEWQNVATDSEEDQDGAFASSASEMMMSSQGDVSSEGEESMVDMDMPESVTDSTDDSWRPMTETVTPSKIEQLVPSETESALNELFGSYMYDQEEWNKLSEDEKEELLNKMLSALGLLEQSSLGSAADVFDNEEEDVESPIEMDNNNILDIPIPAGILEKKDGQDLGQEDEENGPSELDYFSDPQVELDLPDESQPDISTAPPNKDRKHATEEPPTGYVFIALLSGVNQDRGETLVEELANLLDVPQNTFTDITVNDKTITFKVNGNIMAPQDIAETAASFKHEFHDLLDVTITATGVGRETHVKVLETPSDDNSTLVVLTVVLVACVLGILVAVITVYCVRQKVKIKQKLQGLSSGGSVETEASADYQDLCRQRMASKSSEKPEPLSRISSVAMSEGAQPSPSSRSSTSSWSEEPVQSNMDISTGHVVLSYMEDHLKNKDRLHEEWEALCNYEADMCNTKVGASNPSKNRNNSVLPYDHTRVVLNDSSNSSRSDYINASTITDTDPRSPAYIATQAPLPTTLADFWQMVWEQGSVVIVNLCKLTENDVSRHRYWPEEGSALYHIYEVHLVSEHVWCEDYLVRSFYLKNLETQETRTVTQFHFLTWPEDGVPPSPKAALEFRRKVNKSYRGKACPIVVHCSDGVGRSGTYCLMDMVLTRMTKGAKEIDIAATLEHIRDQRPGVVKNKDQFEFALQAVAEEVNAILKALPQ